VSSPQEIAIPAKNKQKPRILILMSLGWNIRNYLRSNVLELLRREADVVVAIRYDDPAFRKEFAGQLAGIEVIPPNTSDRLTAPLRRLVDQAHLIRGGSVTGAKRKKWVATVFKTQLWKRVLHSAQDQLAKLVAWEPLFKVGTATEHWMLSHAYRNSEQGGLLDRVQPDLVVSTFPFNPVEYPITVEANRRGIRTATAILSWDNLTTRGRIIGDYDRYLLWSEIMRDDLLRYYPQVSRQQIVVTGTPQFDFSSHKEEIWEREVFCERLGLDPARALLTYTCVPHRLVPSEHKLIPEIYDALMSANLPRPIEMLVRTHPLGDWNLYKALGEGRPHLTVSRPWPNDQSRYAWFCPSESQLSLLTNTVYHSDVGFNIRSTMTLDFSLFNRPVINIAFGPEGDAEATGFIRDFYQYGYYQPVMQTKAARLAYSLDELVKHTRSYLENPQLDSQNRSEVVQALCGQVDGRAGLRVARALLDLLPMSNANVR